MKEIARRRLQNQHLVQGDFASPAGVVRWFGAVQAQDYLGSLYAIGLRMAGATEAIVEGAVSDGSIVRSWPMRGTVHFMAAEDARWIVRLLGQRTEGRVAAIYRNAGLTSEMITRAGDTFTRAMEGGGHLTRQEIYAALAEAGIDAEESRGLHLLGIWARRGLVCRGPRRGKQHTFALVEEWLPPGRDLRGDEALAELATRYFTSHGPATVHDFAWWTGLKVTDAKSAAEATGHTLVRETLDGKEYWSSADEPGVTLRSGPFLLPAYDEFTVAYADRSAFLDPGMREQVAYGIGNVILIDGWLAGAWKRGLERDRVLISLSPLEPLTTAQQVAVAEAAERYGRFIGLPVALSLDSASRKVSDLSPATGREDG